MMNVFVQIIPCVELLLVLAMLGLGSLDYFSSRAKANQPGQTQYRFAYQFAEKWALPGLIGLAILSILLLFMVSFIQG
jgi:hypothetical protein